MKLSTDRRSHLSHLIHDAIYLDNLVEFKNETKALRTIQKALDDYAELFSTIEQKVVEKITSQKTKIVPGTSQWEVIYQKYWEEELSKRGL